MRRCFSVFFTLVFTLQHLPIIAFIISFQVGKFTFGNEENQGALSYSCISFFLVSFHFSCSHLRTYAQEMKCLLNTWNVYSLLEVRYGLLFRNGHPFCYELIAICIGIGVFFTLLFFAFFYASFR